MGDKKSEARIQQEIVMYFHNEYPQLRGCLCYNNNNSTGGYRGKVNKFLGVIKGRSDMVLYYQGVSYMIELKNSTGKQSKEQKEWQELMSKNMFHYFIIKSLDEFKGLIKTIV